MTIYIVKNERDEEVAAYTNQQHARLIAEQFEEFTFRRYTVEELPCKTSIDESSEV